MNAPASVKSRTIKVKTENGLDVIKMKSRRVTRQANTMGFKVMVNEKDYFVNCFGHEEAFEKAYVRYIKECR